MVSDLCAEAIGLAALSCRGNVLEKKTVFSIQVIECRVQFYHCYGAGVKLYVYN